MRLTTQIDFALRLLMLLALKPDEQHTVEETAMRYRISRNRLAYVSLTLIQAGLIEIRCGGLRLAKPAARITLGAILRATDPKRGMRIVKPDGGLRSPFEYDPGVVRTMFDQFSLAELIAGTGTSRELHKQTVHTLH